MVIFRVLSAPAFLERFVALLVPEPFRELARATGWSRRRGKLDPFEFLTSLIFGQLSALRPTLSAQAQSLGVPVSRQALDQRYNPRAVEFFQVAFAHLLEATLAWAPASPQAGAVRAHFTGLYLLDSTSFDVPATLQAVFPACGGDGSVANTKVLLRYEVITGRLEPLRVLAGKRADQGLALAAAEQLKADELQLQDKGFHDHKAWRAAQDRGAYLLMPLARSASLWLVPAPGGPETALDLAKALAASTADRVEWPAVHLGTKAHRAGPARLVAFRLGAASAARQRQGLREGQRKQGRTPSATALELAGWLVLVTNAPAAKLPAPVLSYLYRLRWQIELIFRQAKSVLRLHQSASADPSRVQCEIWARLCAAVLLFAWHAQASAECWRVHAREASFEKVARLLQHWGLTLARALVAGPDAFAQLVRVLWRQLLHHARKDHQKSRPTTWQNLQKHWLEPDPPTPDQPPAPNP